MPKFKETSKMPRRLTERVHIPADCTDDPSYDFDNEWEGPCSDDRESLYSGGVLVPAEGQPLNFGDTSRPRRKKTRRVR